MTLRRIFLWLLLASLARVAGAALPDPAARGPFNVLRDEYRLGLTALDRPDFPRPAEMMGSVHYPDDLSRGPFPLVVLLHGRHVTCSKGRATRMAWPCPAGYDPIWSYQGYDYLAERLASHGYIVVSPSANGVNAYDSQTPTLGADQRAELLQAHLDQWRTYATFGAEPFGSRFVGHVDLNRIGTLGHSRGGEGVMRHVLYNRLQGAPHAVKAVLALAPTNFSRWVVNDTAFAVLLPYCDGDVKDLQGIHYFDDARYSRAGDPAPKFSAVMLGANHNYFNRQWVPAVAGGFDDWNLVSSPDDPHCGPGASDRLAQPAQQEAGVAYIAAFFRATLGGETALLPFLRGDAASFDLARAAHVIASYQAPDNRSERLDVNPLTQASHLAVNALGGETQGRELDAYRLCGGRISASCEPELRTNRQPHTTSSLLNRNVPGLVQLYTAWTNRAGAFRNELPAGRRDLRGYRTLQFRAGINFLAGPDNGSHDAQVTLVDSAGREASTRIRPHSRALTFPPGAAGPYTKTDENPVPRLLLHTVRLPMSAFGGIDLSDVRHIDVRFDGKAAGSLLLSDLTATDANAAPAASLTLRQAAAATPNPAEQQRTALEAFAVGASGDDEGLTYTWTAAPALVTFSANGTRDARRTVALFRRTGSFVFTVTVADGSGNSLRSSVSVEVPDVQGGGASLEADDLSDVRVYPSPWSAKQHPERQIVFDHLSAGSTVRLYTLSARWVRTLHSQNGAAAWDLTNDHGQPVGSGYYLYLIQDSRGRKARGKVALVR